MTFEQGAACPVAAITALQDSATKKKFSPGKGLVNGASGGVGTIAVQIANRFGIGSEPAYAAPAMSILSAQ